MKRFHLFCCHNNYAYYETYLRGVALVTLTCNRENHVPSLGRNVGHPEWSFFLLFLLFHPVPFFVKKKRFVIFRVWGLGFCQRCCWRFRLCCLVSVSRHFEGSECLQLQAYAVGEELYIRIPQCLESLNLEDGDTTVFRNAGKHPTTQFQIPEDLDYEFSRTLSLSECIQTTSIWFCCIFLSFTAILATAVGWTFLYDRTLINDAASLQARRRSHFIIIHEEIKVASPPLWYYHCPRR